MRWAGLLFFYKTWVLSRFSFEFDSFMCNCPLIKGI
nr:MAG TPA: hypothetical protein [Caudoviricetes sp.]